MNFNHLYYFYTTVEEGGVTAGSKKLSISQPALSSQLKTFEKKLGHQLLVRSGRALTLTEKGKLVYGFARQMFELHEELEDRLNRTEKSKGVRIQLGVSDEIERPLAVRLISFLFKGGDRKLQPMVKLVSGEHEDLVQKLKERRLDAVLTSQPEYHENLDMLGTMRMPVVLAYSPEKKGTKQEGDVFTSLDHTLDFLSRTESGLALPSSRLRLRREIDDFLEHHQIANEVVFESDMMASVARAILDHVGIGFLPYPSVSGDVSRGNLLISGPRDGLWQHSIWLMARKGRGVDASFVNELTRAFGKLSREVLKTLK